MPFDEENTIRGLRRERLSRMQNQLDFDLCVQPPLFGFACRVFPVDYVAFFFSLQDGYRPGVFVSQRKPIRGFFFAPVFFSLFIFSGRFHILVMGVL